MDVKDVHRYQRGWAFMFKEKGGKQHRVPASHKAEDYMLTYLEAAGIAEDRKGPLFRTLVATSSSRRTGSRRRTCYGW